MSANAPPGFGVPVRLLFVCMGNVCRSPMAAAVVKHLAQQLASQLPLEVDSAGTHGYKVGEPPDQQAQQIALSHGIDLSALRARQLIREDFERFDLILTMDRRNQRAAVALAPARHRKRVRLFLDYAPESHLREIPDPYLGDPEDFEHVFELVEQAGRGLLQVLRSSRLSSP